MALSASQDARGQGSLGVYSKSLDDEHRRRFTLIEKLRSTLATGEGLSLVYQPRVDLRSGACVAVEALLRWTDPELGAVSPGEFIPLAEKTTLARGITEWVVNAAVSQIVEWRSHGIGVAVSLNISATNLAEPDFAERVITRLAEADLPASAIEIELTESAALSNGEAALAQLDRLAAAGLRIAIDDFGAGYSSLSYLERLPASVLKIDRSFVGHLEKEPRARTLVGTMITMGHDLGYRVVAEGVETDYVYGFLAEQDCDEAQGYLMSRPLAPEAFADWFALRHATSGRP
ncbi:putative bifunctional diguanylate cyclase/phosphodiesterase [Hansschlegelia beijingensis]